MKRRRGESRPETSDMTIDQSNPRQDKTENHKITPKSEIKGSRSK
jgi:hypothetical protein